MKSDRLRVLNFEDDATDSELIQAELENEWTNLELLRVETREGFVHALEQFRPDIVLSDFRVLGMNGEEALQIVRQSHPEIPVVMVTGALGDIEAVRLVKQGARDYVMKNHLHRLNAAVQGALSQEYGIRARKAAELALRQSEAEIRELVEHSPIAMVVDIGIGEDERVALMNRRFTLLFGYTREDIPDVQHWWLQAYPDEQYREQLRAQWEARVEQAVRNHGAVEPMETTVTCKDGSLRYVRVSFASIGSRNIVTFEDLTEHKRDEAHVRRLFQLYAALSECNQAIVHSDSETELLTRVCAAIVKFGSFRMAWIGMVDPTTHWVVPIASSGDNAAAYLDGIRISTEASSEYGRGPTGTAIREDRPFWCEDFFGTEATVPWWKRAKTMGWRSSAALPLHRDGVVVGALTMYADSAYVFDEDVRTLLAEMAADIDHSLNYFRQDVERKRAEAELRKLSLAVEQSPSSIVITDLDANLEYVNEAFVKSTGYSREEALGRNPRILHSGKTSPETYARMWACLAGGSTWQGEMINRRKDGSEYIESVRIAPVHDKNGRTTHYLGIKEDITERKRVEQALQESERKFRVMAASAQDAIAMLDSAGNISFWNAAAENIFGYREQEALGRDLHELIAPTRFHDAYHRGIAHFRKTGEGPVIGKTLELVALHRNGNEFPIEISLSAVEVAGRWQAIGIIRDITGRKQAQNKLQMFRALLDHSSDIIEVLNLETLRLFDINETGCRETGYGREEILAMDIHDLDPTYSAISRQEIAEQIRQSGHAQYESIRRRRDGTTFPVEISATRIELEQPYLLNVVRDITERKRIELQMLEQYRHVAEINVQLTEANRELEQAKHQLLQSEKMAAIGLLAAGVAHEINNPVGYVNSNLGTLEKYLADIMVILDKYTAAEAVLGADNPLLEELRQFKVRVDFDYLRADIKALLAESHQGLDRIKKIILDLKDFSRADTDEQWVWADLHHGLDSTLNVVWNELKYKCEVVKEYGDLPKVWCLPSQLNQVFMNLLVNAAQAIEVRGRIVIRTGWQGEQVWVEVEDTGKGIPPEIVSRIFDPFFTTKPVGKGTGLGLSVSYNIVEKHHGHIEVRSEVGRGTAFRVWLPVGQETAA